MRSIGSSTWLYTFLGDLSSLTLPPGEKVTTPTGLTFFAHDLVPPPPPVVEQPAPPPPPPIANYWMDAATVGGFGGMMGSGGRPSMSQTSWPTRP